MLNYFTNVTVPLLASVAIPGVLPFSVLPPPPVKAPPFSIIKEFDTGVKPLPKTATVKPKEKRFVCTSCSDNEKRALDFLQDKGIKDKNALATIMGNIRQESTFEPKDGCASVLDFEVAGRFGPWWRGRHTFYKRTGQLL